jgi:hypothetical protein
MAWVWFGIVQILGIAGWLQKGYPWVRFIAAQFFQLEAMVVGWFLLIPLCVAQAWEMSSVPSIKDGSRPIDRWSWRWVGVLYDNPEDGVSGAQALVWLNGQQVPYMPKAWAPWRAYCWSAWRNSADNLKYVFAWDAGPFRQWTLFGRPQHAGWQIENGFRVPVLSL